MGEWKPGDPVDALCEHLASRTNQYKVCTQCWRDRAVALAEELAALPGRWPEDSSLETWFPFTARDLTELKAERDELKTRIADLEAALERWMEFHKAEHDGFEKCDGFWTDCAIAAETQRALATDGSDE